MLAILSQPNHHISEQEQVHISTDKIAEPAAMTQALCYWHSNLFVPAVQPLPEVKVGFNWSPNFTRQIRKPHPTITDSIADLMQVLLWNDIDSSLRVTSSIFTSERRHWRSCGRRNVGIEEKCCQRPPGNKAGCQYNHELATICPTVGP